jgi:hypothetical protein
MEDIAIKFDNLFKVISSDDFLDAKNLGGEIPFFISAYEARQHNEVSKAIKGLKNRLELSGKKVLELNLYDISLNIIEREIGLKEMFSYEEQMDTDEFKSALQSVLDLKEAFMPELKKMIDSSDADVYFITGIGNVYPYIRSHNVLNNLQNIAKDAPTIMFFPGEYDGLSLRLFGLLKDDNYYRAFMIDKYQLK